MGQPLPTNDAREHETHSVVSVGEAPGCGSEYRDFSRDCAQSIRKQLPKEKRRGPRGGVVKPFPVRLYNMLDGLQEEGLESIASWQVHGRSFAVHKPNEFVNRVLPKYFSQTKLTSFQRQLNLYGFLRLSAGSDRGAYYHELFLRGRPDLAQVMIRTRVKGSGLKAPSSRMHEPDFYQMKPCFDRRQATPASPTHSEVTLSPVPMHSSPPASIRSLAVELPLPSSLSVARQVSDIFPESLFTPLTCPPIIASPGPLPCPPTLRPPETAFFEGQRFTIIDEPCLDEFEHKLIHDAWY